MEVKQSSVDMIKNDIQNFVNHMELLNPTDIFGCIFFRCENCVMTICYLFNSVAPASGNDHMPANIITWKGGGCQYGCRLKRTDSNFDGLVKIGFGPQTAGYVLSTILRLLLK